MKEDIYNKIEKVVVNVGIGRKAQESSFKDKILPAVSKDLAAITSQKPSPRPSKKSIAGFKLREGTTVGLKTTLRQKKMRHFIERLVNVVLPRVRDFRGINHSAIDGQGNLSIGIKDHVVFPEIVPENTKVSFGMQVNIVPQGIKSREEAFELYKKMNFPFKKGELEKLKKR